MSVREAPHLLILAEDLAVIITFTNTVAISVPGQFQTNSILARYIKQADFVFLWAT